MKTEKIKRFKDLEVKNSKGRIYIAKCLNVFRRNMSISKTAEVLGINPISLYGILHCSKKFNDTFYFYRKYSHVDQGIAMMWAKKIMSINYLGGKCQKCGEKNIFHLCFHHTNGKEEKVDSIRHFLKKTFKTIQRELDKCTLLCKNCHQELHFVRESSLKSTLLKMAGQKQCYKCGYIGNSLSSLSFHHKNKEEKLFQISNYCHHDRNKFSKDIGELESEVQKCDVLCFNCHSLEHINIKRFEQLKKLIYHKVRFYNEKKPKTNKKS